MIADSRQRAAIRQQLHQWLLGDRRRRLMIDDSRQLLAIIGDRRRILSYLERKWFYKVHFLSSILYRWARVLLGVPPQLELEVQVIWLTCTKSVIIGSCSYVYISCVATLSKIVDKLVEVSIGIFEVKCFHWRGASKVSSSKSHILSISVATTTGVVKPIQHRRNMISACG